MLYGRQAVFIGNIPAKVAMLYQSIEMDLKFL